MAVTISDVARRAGVSIKTVSRVINQELYVSPGTRAKVQAAMNELGYTANITARRLATGRSKTIGVIFHNASWKYINLVIQSVITTCHQHGYSTLIHPFDIHDQQDYQNVVALGLQRSVDGLLFTPPCDNSTELLDELDKARIPYLRLTPTDRSRCMPYVTTSDIQGAFEMARHLISLGHTNFGYIFGPREQRAPHDRFAGFNAALAECELELKGDYIRQGDDHFDSGIECAREMLKLEPRPSAIFANNDEMALGALVAASELNYAVPRQVSIAGFDDIPHARQVWPPLTTVRQPIYEMAELATHLLIRILQGEVIGQLHHEISSKLIIRGSTGRVETAPAWPSL